MWSESPAPKPLTLASVFGIRKKRINSSKTASDDVKGASASLINTAQTVPNGFIDSDMDSLKELQPPVAPAESRIVEVTKKSLGRTTPSNSFIEKIRHSKDSRSKVSREQAGTRSESMPVQFSTLPDRLKQTGDAKKLGMQDKSLSANAVYMATKDPRYLMEALQTLADEQPIVARSIPKHALVDTTQFAKHSLDNCLFDASVYDSMLDDSLKTCQLLQEHLNQCIACVRAQSPVEPDVELRLRLPNDVADSASLSSDENSSQPTVIVSPKRDSKRLSALTTDTSISSVDSRVYVPEISLKPRLKSTVQYQC